MAVSRPILFLSITSIWRFYDLLNLSSTSPIWWFFSFSVFRSYYGSPLLFSVQYSNRKFSELSCCLSIIVSCSFVCSFLYSNMMVLTHLLFSVRYSNRLFLHLLCFLSFFSNMAICSFMFLVSHFNMNADTVIVLVIRVMFTRSYRDDFKMRKLTSINALFS